MKRNDILVHFISPIANAFLLIIEREIDDESHALENRSCWVGYCMLLSICSAPAQVLVKLRLSPVRNQLKTTGGKMVTIFAEEVKTMATVHDARLRGTTARQNVQSEARS